MKLFYRLQLLEHVAVTPDIEVLVNPASSPDTDGLAVMGVRARFAF